MPDIAGDNAGDDAGDNEGQEQEWLGDDLEMAYRQALEANQAVEWMMGPVAEGDDKQPQVDPTEVVCAEGADAASPVAIAEPHDDDEATDSAVAAPVTPEQVVEAALFVGGTALTTKRLCTLLRGSSDRDFVEKTIGDLNRRYEREARPYEIRLAEGGYRLVLRPEFEPIRNRVFGLGPKEVRLSQDALEVLALVAYHQPITKQQVEDQGKRNAGTILQQLLRRELISLERDGKSRKNVKYRTAPRFLSLFGLSGIDELPQADELDLK